MRTTWDVLLLPSLTIFLIALIGTQGVFLYTGLFEDTGFGTTGDTITLLNFKDILSDPLYLRSIGLTVRISAMAVLIAFCLGFPVAYVLARWQSPWATVLLTIIVASSFVTIVVKALGLNIIFGAEGPLNNSLVAMRLIDSPIRFSGEFKVLVGLTQYTIGFFVLLLFGVLQTIPRSLEEAARIHGASWLRMFFRVIVPLALPGVLNGGLIVFNLCMGAFTSAALLGGGRVLTLPVMIQQTLMVETRYGMAAALATVLLVLVLVLNLISLFLAGRGGLLRHHAER